MCEAMYYDSPYVWQYLFRSSCVCPAVATASGHSGMSICGRSLHMVCAVLIRSGPGLIVAAYGRWAAAAIGTVCPGVPYAGCAAHRPLTEAKRR